jgi:hypothetical protein
MPSLEEAITNFVAAVMEFVQAVLSFSLWPLFWFFGIDLHIVP